MVTSLDPKTFEKKKRLFIELNGAIRDHLQEVGVAVIGMLNGRPHEIGSGTCIQVGGRYFVATAAHVIEDYTNDNLWLITRPERSDTTPRIIGRGWNTRLDIAWLEIAPGAVPHLRRRFIEIERLRRGVDHVECDLCVVYGFPGGLVRLHEAENGLGVRPLCFATNTLTPDKRPSTCVAMEDIFLEYPDHDLIDLNGHPVSGINAKGLSGGGVWTMEVNASGVWSPEKCQLVGIEHCWKPWAYVRGTQIQHWLELVASDIPELATTIRGS